MPNANPIKKIDTGTYPDYLIPKNLKDKTFYVTVATTISDQTWLLYLLHSLSVDGDPVNINPNPDITRQDLGTISDLDSIQFALSTTITRIRNGAPTATPPNAIYTVTFEADNTVIDTFVFTTDSTNPITLYTKITFKLTA